jgi:HSP20 family protein
LIRFKKLGAKKGYPMNQIEETINEVERLYQRVTGKSVPSEIQTQPRVEGVDPALLLDEKLNQLLSLLNEPQVVQSLQPIVPPMNAWESQDNYMIRIEMPGVKKEDIDLTIRGQYLIVNGLRKNSEMSGFVPKLIETKNGCFQKVVNLPQKCSTKEIHSEIKEEEMQTVNCDITKLQLLTERIHQTLEALNQVRFSSQYSAGYSHIPFHQPMFHQAPYQYNWASPYQSYVPQVAPQFSSFIPEQRPLNANGFSGYPTVDPRFSQIQPTVAW